MHTGEVINTTDLPPTLGKPLTNPLWCPPKPNLARLKVEGVPQDEDAQSYSAGKQHNPEQNQGPGNWHEVCRIRHIDTAMSFGRLHVCHVLCKDLRTLRVLASTTVTNLSSFSLRTLRSSFAWRRTLSDGAQSGEEKGG